MTRRAWRWLLMAALCVTAASARAAWRPADLPYGIFVQDPVTGLAPAGGSGLWAVAPYWYGDPSQNSVRWNSLAWRSLNDGRLWDMPWDAPGNDPTPNSHSFQDVQLFAASFADDQNGWLFGWRRPTYGVNDPPGDFSFYHTTDAGRTWTETTLPNTAPDAADMAGFSIDAVDATHAIAVHGRHVFETADGAAWTERAGNWPVMRAVQARGLPAPRVAGEEDGRAVSGILTPTGFVADATADGAFHAVAFTDAQHGWLAGGGTAGGTVLHTSDGGVTWSAVLSVPGVVFHGIAAPATTRAWAAGERTDGPGGVVYATQDGGGTWSLEFTTPGALRAVSFRDALRGFVSGDDGVYLYAPDTPAPGDLDGSGQVDVVDAANVLRGAAGLRATSGMDTAVAGGPLTIAAAVEALLGRQGAPPDPASRAVVVYNTVSADSNANGVGDSEEIARYYAMRRGIPEDHLVPVTWHREDLFTGDASPSQPRANWTACFHAFVEPLRARLDALGHTDIDTIVIIKGVPYAFWTVSPDGSSEQLIVDQSINDLYGVDALNWSSTPAYSAPFTSIAERYGKSRFGVGGRPMGQPFVDASGAPARGPYYLTGRVDGPSVDACKAMVDNAIFAETYRGPGGYEGVAYIDTRASVSNYPSLGAYDLNGLRTYLPRYNEFAAYDRAIARSILSFADRGLPWRDEVTNDTIGDPGGWARWRDGTPATAAPRAMFYAGWYNYGTYNAVWDWLPGSVAIDFDSASAAGFRDGRYFAGGALNAGVSALVGVLDEPYNFHPKPEALMEYLARGFTLAEAAMLATDIPRTARAITLGDPLYRPFAPHPPRAVPAPTLTPSAAHGGTGWTVTLESDIPVRATLRYTTDGSEPDADSAVAPASPRFFARHHTFSIPDAEMLRFTLEAEDATGRVTSVSGP